MNFDINIILENWHIFVEGFGVTVLICALALPAGFGLGIILALFRLSHSRTLDILAVSFIELVRNTPFLIQIYIVFFVFPSLGLNVEPMTAAFICLTVYGAAYFAENVRGAIMAIPKGQTEAAKALGLNYWQIQTKIIFPQMLAYLIPTTTNLTLSLIKDTAILSVITVPELTYQAQVLIAGSFVPVEGYTTIALMYWGLNSLVAALMLRWEASSCHYLDPETARTQKSSIKTFLSRGLNSCKSEKSS